MKHSPVLNFETRYEIDINIEDSALAVAGIGREKTEEILTEEMLEVALRHAVEETLRQQEAVEAALTIVIGSDEDVQRLNRDYRGIDAVTDVLSFSNHEQQDAGSTANQATLQLVLPPELQEEQALYLGDIVIAASCTARQAKRFRRSIIDEFQLLAIHGTLHLLGFDHDMTEKKELMWMHQDAALLALGLAPTDAERST